MNISEICEKLKKNRDSRGISLAIVAAATGVDVGQLSRIERGKCRYISKNMQKYCKYLDVRYDMHSDKSALLSRIEKLMQKSPQNEDVFYTLVKALEKVSNDPSF